MSIPYEKHQEKWIKRHNVKVGDLVTVTRRYDSKTCGAWSDLYYWTQEMDKFVGNSCKVVKVCKDSIRLSFYGSGMPYYFPYSVLRKEKEVKKSYIERQDEWIKKNDIKIGDKVRIIRKAADMEDGWGVGWASSSMDSFIGKEARVRRINGRAGIHAGCDNGLGSWNFPYFVLEKVVKHKDKEWEVSYGLKVKTGDLVLVRDGRDDDWRFSLFSHVTTVNPDEFPYKTVAVGYRICIPYVGNEHLVGTKMDYKAPEEPTKPKFIFGAKVKATLSCGDEMEGVLIGFDHEDDDTPFEVAVRDEDADLGRIRYCAKSVTYID